LNPDHLILSDEQKYKLRSLAIQCLNISYKFGAEILDLSIEPQNIKEIDCSELIEYLFRKALGLVVPDGSYNQFGVSEEIKREEGQFGDLVFMRSKETNQICHVALYDGNGMVYEASGFYKKVINRNLDAFAKETSHAKYAGMRCLLKSKIKTI
jgi:cell wall-associated NlpC family hydrolase